MSVFFLIAPVLYADPSAELRTRLDAVAQRALTQQGAVGIVVGVVHEGEPAMFSYGERIKGAGEKPDGTTLFQIGSITKTFVAALLADFVRNGTMRLDDPVSKYLPRVQVPTYGARQITLLDLVTHTSGLPRNLGQWRDKQATVEQMFGFLGRCKLQSAPGDRYLYSNLGFAVLAEAIGHAGKAPWPNLLRREITGPLHLDQTTIELTPQQLEHRAQGYGAAGRPAPWHSNLWPAMSGAGGLYSNMNDMLKYLSFNMGINETPLNELLPIMQQPRHPGSKGKGEIGLAWEIRRAPGGDIIWKNGSTPGFHSFIGFNPQRKTGVVVLCNSAIKPIVFASEVFKFYGAPDRSDEEENHDADTEEAEAENSQ